MAINTTQKPLIFRFIESGAEVILELTNRGDQALKSVEILTVFLEDKETFGGGPSQAHIKFESIESMRPKEIAVLSPRTWINGKPVDKEHDQVARLKEIAGQVTPYVLDISWRDTEEKMRFQRIPVGH